MKKRYIVTLTILLLVNFASAQISIFDEANELYKQGKYEESIKKYEQLQQKDTHSATIYFNLGNAYFKQGKLANAILNYERAYKLKPSDKDIVTNLNFAKAQIADKIEVPKQYFFAKWWDDFVRSQHSNEKYAIVFAQNVTANSTPSNNGTELFILHEGTKVKILDKVGNWNKIQLADKREGWLPMKEILQI